MHEPLNTPLEDAKHIACKLLDHKLRRFDLLGVEACPICDPAEYRAYKEHMYMKMYGRYWRSYV